MKRLDIKNSSNIKSVGFEDGILEVEFKQGVIYHYSPVTYSDYINLLAAESKSKWLNINIKNNQNINFKKVG